MFVVAAEIVFLTFAFQDDVPVDEVQVVDQLLVRVVESRFQFIPVDSEIFALHES